MAGAPYPYYAPLLRGLHWLMFILLVVAAAGGLSFDYIPKESALFGTVMLYHKSLGLLLLALVVVRVLLRLLLGSPAYKPPIGGFNEKIAGLAHLLLYAVMIALPIAGYVTAMAGKHEFAWFGFYPVPNYIPASETLAKSAEEAHGLLAYALFGLVGLHLLAALWHKIRGDGVYERMWPAKA
jgi:cytochrome b561